jgi:hypothetical protein
MRCGIIGTGAGGAVTCARDSHHHSTTTPSMATSAM